MIRLQFIIFFDVSKSILWLIKIIQNSIVEIPLIAATYYTINIIYKVNEVPVSFYICHQFRSECVLLPPPPQKKTLNYV